MLHSFIKKFTKNPNNLPMLILTYCIAVPVPHIPVSPDSHKNFVNVSSLVRLYVIVLERLYWHPRPDRVDSEWIGVWANPVKLNSLAFWAHHLMVWNNRRYIYFINPQKTYESPERLHMYSTFETRNKRFEILCTNLPG